MALNLQTSLRLYYRGLSGMVRFGSLRWRVVHGIKPRPRSRSRLTIAAHPGHLATHTESALFMPTSFCFLPFLGRVVAAFELNQPQSVMHRRFHFPTHTHIHTHTHTHTCTHTHTHAHTHTHTHTHTLRHPSAFPIVWRPCDRMTPPW